MEFIKDNIIPGEVFIQLIAFLIVFFTLKAVAWGPLQRLMEERRKRIANDFAQIEHAKKDIERLKTEYAALVQKIEDEARAKLQEAVNEGVRIAKEIQEKARTDSQATYEKAKENLEVEIGKARLTLRREIADLTVNATERILKEKLSSAEYQQAKIMSMIEELEKTL